MQDLMIKYEDYWVCTDGNIYTTKCINITTIQGKKHKVLKQMKPYENKHGYLRVKLYVEGQPIQYFVHQLMLIAFKGILKGSNKELIDTYIKTSFKNEPKQPEQLVIDHIDGDKQNNSLQNLQIITQAENLKKRNYHK